MRLEEIKTLWETDAKIDKSELVMESLNVANLHHKYYKLYLIEKKELRKMESHLKKIRLQKKVFLTQGPSKDPADPSRLYEWKLPPHGKVLKSEVEDYLEADDDISTIVEKVEDQKDKVQYLYVIIDRINKRQFDISNAQKHLEWSNGQ